MPNLSANTLHWLNAPIDPGRVSRFESGPAKGAPYLEGDDVIDALNHIFGFGEWSFELISAPWVAESGVEGQNKTPYEVWCCMGKLTIGGITHTGFGTNVRSGTGSASLEMAIKGVATDALKRAAVHHGDQFGLSLRRKPAQAILQKEWDAWQADMDARRARAAEAKGAHIAQSETVTNHASSASPDRSPMPPAEQVNAPEPDASPAQAGRLTVAAVEAAFRAEKRASSIAGAWLTRSDIPRPVTQELLDRWSASNPDGTAAELVYQSMVWMSTDAANKSLAEACQKWLDERKERAA